MRPKGLGVVQGGCDYAKMRAEVESKRDKGGLKCNAFLKLHIV